METYFEHLRSNYDQKVRIFSDVKAGLEHLKAAGYRLGVVTNQKREFTVRGLELGQILPFFDTIVTLDDVKEGKPSPQPVIQAMVRIGAKPEETLMIGDSKYDVLAASAAKVKSAVLEWYGKADWKVVVPDYHFDNFLEFMHELATVKRQSFWKAEVTLHG